MSEPLAHIFHDLGDDFEACRAATDLLKAAGFSIGSMERGKPRGILFGDFAIAKWRNLSHVEVRQLHGLMEVPPSGRFRTGPVYVTLTNDAPPEARAAFEAAIAEHLRKPAPKTEEAPPC